MPEYRALGNSIPKPPIGQDTRDAAGSQIIQKSAEMRRPGRCFRKAQSNAMEIPGQWYLRIHCDYHLGHAQSLSEGLDLILKRYLVQ